MVLKATLARTVEHFLPKMKLNLTRHKTKLSKHHLFLFLCWYGEMSQTRQTFRKGLIRVSTQKNPTKSRCYLWGHMHLTKTNYSTKINSLCSRRSNSLHVFNRQDAGANLHEKDMEKRHKCSQRKGQCGQGSLKSFSICRLHNTIKDLLTLCVCM
ncbi:hypothetical protein CHARACLAT_024119 [Characodon lateralis]|uniref:Uncharacterized protein n=1 Tax=Characodon lateralis TaxID=208331 RepID=A0ABU7CRI8_9TELE|nr:hypothetical protein [Characodon lateralis]